ncbi:LLM class flavin-dependent oxidoreductase [Paenibacillus sp. OV219]|uniref:LLM class flavin-dependent oxidoreductase n=1 Tax=Paenibacillus sp. OV219 TaxID=1884377 RepID=UPI0008D16C41|nr:LLM class flavin-dependent oxidoreductase [Paenibacillus sp. OV219]SEO37563.1 luciferase family oxidoreductase, group 1 [Paenibacillus sp. OV219]
MTDPIHVPLSVLDLAPVIEGATPADAFRNTLELARHVERLGYNRYWLAEHHNMAGIASSATSVVIGYVAGGTERIRVGSGGIMLPNHAPLVIAEQFGTLESMYPGRIDLGLGRAPGSDQTTARALRRDLATHGQEFPELLAELRAYFHPPADDHRPVRATPGEGSDVPIWLLGSSGFSAKLAGELGLPFSFASHFAPEYLMPAIHLYRSSFRPSEALAKPYIMIGVNIVAADTDAAARYLATSQQQQFLSLIRGHPGKLKPPIDNMDELWMPHERDALQSKFKYAIAGSKSTVEARLQEILHETMADELIVTSQIYDHETRLRSYEIVAEAAGMQRSI